MNFETENPPLLLFQSISRLRIDFAYLSSGGWDFVFL